ncbi:MAG: hypothetical protein KDE04_08360, partial [Anaerolineales bacterium]|nr:hypothetical protein [Anaerolineales bacterium]
MPDISTTYLGLKLQSPVIASSTPLAVDPDNVRRMAEMGVGAVVLPSLFEEQLMIDRLGMGAWVKNRTDLLPGKLKHFPDMSNHNEGVANYLTHIFGLKQ